MREAVKRVAGVIATAIVLSLFACSSYGTVADAPGDAGAEGGGGRGQLQQDGLTIVPAALTLAPFKCGDTSTGAITLVNDGSEEQTYEATLPANDVFTIRSGATGVVKSHDSATIAIEAKAQKPATAAVDVAIKTKSAVGTVNVSAEVQGATLSITPHNADFGFVKENQISAPINAIFTNEGSTPITINGFDGPAEKSSFGLPSTIVVPANGTITSPITMTAGPAGALITAVVTPKVDSTLCGAPDSLTLTGQRVSDDVIVSPASADFGAIDCGGTTTTKVTITVSNFSLDKTATFTTSLPSGSRFSVTPTNGTLPVGTGTAPSKVDLAIAVVNAGDQIGPVTETLAVTIGSKTYTIKLTMNVSGAILQVNPTSLQITSGMSKNFTVTNVGNASTCISVDSNNAKLTTSSSNTPLAASFPSTIRVDFSSATNVTGTLSIKRVPCLFGATAPFCKPPPTVTVIGTANPG